MRRGRSGVLTARMLAAVLFARCVLAWVGEMKGVTCTFGRTAEGRLIPKGVVCEGCG